MNNPLVSIIIPTYNRAHLIGETLDSVSAQTYENWECIIVDDGSNDNTVEVIGEYLKKDGRFKFYNRPVERPKGANACRNYGFEMSKGEYVMFLDSDDICEIFCVSDRVSLITKDSTIDLLIRDTSYLIDNEKHFFSINKDPKLVSRDAYLRMFLRYEIPWPIMGVFYKRNILQNCRFDENLSRFQDVSLNIKVLSKFDRLSFLRDHKIDCYYRVDKNKINSEGFVGIVLNSLVVFYRIHKKLVDDCSYKLDLRKFNNKIIHEFAIFYFSKNRKESNKVFMWSLSSNIYNLNQKLILFLLMFFLNFNILHKKGIGMNKFRNLYKAIIN